MAGKFQRILKNQTRRYALTVAGQWRIFTAFPTLYAFVLKCNCSGDRGIPLPLLFRHVPERLIIREGKGNVKKVVITAATDYSAFHTIS
jgi:hypothetical protein